MRPAAWASALLLAASSASAQIYKCTDANGQPVFSDRPCASNAEVVEIDVPEASGTDLGGSEGFEGVARDNAQRSAERKVERIEAYLRRLQDDHNRKIDRLDDQLSDLGYSKLDSSTRDRLLEKKEAEYLSYRKKRSRAYDDLRDAKMERSRAGWR